MRLARVYFRSLFLIALCGIVLLPSPGNAQSTGESRVATRVPAAEPRVTVNLKGARLKDILLEIGRKGKIELSYSESLIPANRRVSVNVKDVPVTEALRQVLKGTNVKLTLIGDKIVLYRDNETPAKNGAIQGKVIDRTTGLPVKGVTVAIDGTDRAVTDEHGSFTISDVVPGSYSIAVRLLGYGTVRRTITVSELEPTSIEISLNSVSTVLQEVVTTGSGERKRLEVGNTISTINADSIVKSQPVLTLSDLLANRVEGMNVSRGTSTVGSPRRIRIRGSSSVNSTNDPIVMIDGVRIATDYTSCRDLNTLQCNQTSSRLDDIDINMIESIDVLKGPAASTLYGSEAANGVIVIKTKRGKAGPTMWSLSGTTGYTYASDRYLPPVIGLGSAVNGTYVGVCTLQDQAQGICTLVDSVAGGLNIMSHPLTTSIARGRNSSASATASGGTQSLQYSLTLSVSDQLGTSKLPEINRRLIQEARGGAKLPGWMLRPNSGKNTSVSGRLTGDFTNKADYAISVSFGENMQRLGPNGFSGGYPAVRELDDTLTPLPEWQQFYVERKNEVSRVLGNASVNWRPFSFASANLVFGRDLSYRDDFELARRNECHPMCMSSGSPDSLGRLRGGRTTTVVKYINSGASFTLPLQRQFALRIATGGQLSQHTSRNLGGQVFDLPPGRTTFAGANGTPVITETGDDRAVAGVYLDNSISWRERLFLSAAIRKDAGSSLGADIMPSYPKWNASWLVSEEDFFPWKDLISLRLRAAYGHAGIMPGSLTKYRTYSQSSWFVRPDGTFGQTINTLAGIGNDELRPERSVESESGFELGIWQDRVNLGFTYYHKFTKDALIRAPIAPSLGLSSTQMRNIGDVKNSGVEFSISSNVINTPHFNWTSNWGFSTRNNKLVTLGVGVVPFTTNSGDLESSWKSEESVIAEGYPLFSRWSKPILAYDDVNGDGIIVLDEIRISDEFVYMGPSEPKFNININNGFGFLNDRFRLSADFSYTHKMTQFNQGDIDFARAGPAAYFRDQVSLYDQACIVAASVGNYTCFFETVSYLRFNSLGLTFMAPPSIARLVKARSASFALLANNLALWSTFSGSDPDLNTASAGGNDVASGRGFPEPRAVSFRVNLSF